MLGIACIFVSCSLFIHLGLGDTMNKVLRMNFVLFRCVKCLTFWSVLCYSLFILNVEQSVCVAFVLSYASLWVELLLSILTIRYEKWYKGLDAEESEGGNDIR